LPSVPSSTDEASISWQEFGCSYEDCSNRDFRNLPGYRSIGNQTAAFFDQIKVMLAFISKAYGNDRLRLLVDDQLCFLGVMFLFATVVLALLFFGRSIGCSVASISTFSISV
jgi:hypothetical protein